MISIIVPVYNAEKYIERCIESIINQTYRNFELILIDDGSTDDTGQICDSYSFEDCRIQSIHQKNGGAASARNTGIECSKGEYIVFVDSDDYLSIDFLEKMYFQITRSDYDCCICGYYLVVENGNQFSKIDISKSIEMTGLEALKERYLNDNHKVNIVNPWGKIFKKEIFDKIRFSEGLYYEDLDIMPYIYLNMKKIRFMDDCLYYYYIRLGSCSHGIGEDVKRIVDSVFIRQKHIQYYIDQKENKLASKAIQLLLELLIEIGCNGWDKENEKEYKAIFNKYFLKIIFSKDIFLKHKLRYLFYFTFNPDYYTTIVKRGDKSL
ncbi:glycosyltransferase family 2 protein [Thomasclavelia cocleata]|uniref:glycosyltransferase family 2 protein n=1 Tax=Thomasclavelia cocleata TaxID=69824 RepID=UPI00242D9F7F|nr:glycosyltransferase [Thomasclavelia cocleata]